MSPMLLFFLWEDFEYEWLCTNECHQVVGYVWVLSGVHHDVIEGGFGRAQDGSVS
jgi:hypothetical protein